MNFMNVITRKFYIDGMWPLVNKQILHPQFMECYIESVCLCASVMLSVFDSAKERERE